MFFIIKVEYFSNLKTIFYIYLEKQKTFERINH